MLKPASAQTDTTIHIELGVTNGLVRYTVPAGRKFVGSYQWGSGDGFLLNGNSFILNGSGPMPIVFTEGDVISEMGSGGGTLIGVETDA